MPYRFQLPRVPDSFDSLDDVKNYLASLIREIEMQQIPDTDNIDGGGA